MKLDRRKFIKVSSASVAGIGISPGLATKLVSNASPICIFSKCLQFLNYEELGEIIANLGFDGADLTVRKGGHVLPENVKTDLPRAAKAIQKAGVDALMIATGINDANDRNTEDILATASDLGIKYYRMGSFIYDEKISVFENLDNCKWKLEKIEKLNRKYNIKGGYQNHSGSWGMIGGAVWDLHYILQNFDPEYVGIQYDIAHATAEGGFSWELVLKVIKPWITSLAIKDFLWEEVEERWKTEWTPLGEGMVNFKKYRNEITPLLFSLPITIHYEYDLWGAELGNTNPSMPPEEIYKKLKRDLDYFKETIIATKGKS